MPSIIVHGGAGRVPDEILQQRKPVLEEAAQLGFRRIKEGASALKAVEEAVCVLETSPVFNAGIGSVLTIDGTVEMDAALMDSRGKVGAVATLKNTEHPVSVARRVMEDTDHSFLAGDGLEEFVEAYDLPAVDPVTERRREQWKELMEKLEEAGYDTGSIPDPREWGHCKHIVREVLQGELEEEQGTVGAVALDQHGNLAAATSTGGTSYKYPGRVGDTPIIGGGTYATPNGAVSATGDGESIMRTVLAKHTVDLMDSEKAPEAARNAIDYATRSDANCGLIAVDPEGNTGEAFNTESMETAVVSQPISKQ